jgi:hypothetical protein
MLRAKGAVCAKPSCTSLVCVACVAASSMPVGRQAAPVPAWLVPSNQHCCSWLAQQQAPKPQLAAPAVAAAAAAGGHHADLQARQRSTPIDPAAAGAGASAFADPMHQQSQQTHKALASAAHTIGEVPHGADAKGGTAQQERLASDSADALPPAKREWLWLMFSAKYGRVRGH